MLSKLGRKLMQLAWLPAVVPARNGVRGIPSPVESVIGCAMDVQFLTVTEKLLKRP